VSAIPKPELVPHRSGGLSCWVDPTLRAENGVVVAFTERTGGVSAPPFASLNLGTHVGDDPAHVAENRRRMLFALGLEAHLSALTTAEQVHGTAITRVSRQVVPGTVPTALAAAPRAPAPGCPPVPAADGLMTTTPAVPLLMCYADCVPVVLVAPGPAVCVVHAGWRGMLGGIVSKAVGEVARQVCASPSKINAYIGPHIQACHYEADETIISQFVSTFGTVTRAHFSGLDLAAAAMESLVASGIMRQRVVSMDVCTAEEGDRFFSYRAEGGTTGRHGALACIDVSSSG